MVAFSSYILGAANLVPYLSKLVPLPVLLAALVVPSLAFSAAVSAFRYALVQDHTIEAVLVFPAAWTSYEFILSLVSPHGTAGSVAYSQADFSQLVQICSLTGIWGITFLLTFVPAAVAAAWYLRGSWKRSAYIAFAMLGVITISLLYATLRSTGSTDRQFLSVGLVASDTTQGYFNTTERNHALTVMRAFLQQVDQLSRLGAEVVLLPEKCVRVMSQDSGSVVGILMDAARSKKVMIIVGVSLTDSARHRNLALVFSDDGGLLATYEKTFLIPGFEASYQRGTSITLFSVASTRAGLLICKDMDFPQWVRQYERAGARILFVPAWDFGDDAWLHSRMAVLRGVELGCAVVRSASEGLLSVSDYRGNTVEIPSSNLPMGSLVTRILPGPGETLYSVAGDWFAWLNVVGLAVILGRNISRGLRRPVS